MGTSDYERQKRAIANPPARVIVPEAPWLEVDPDTAPKTQWRAPANHAEAEELLGKLGEVQRVVCALIAAELVEPLARQRAHLTIGGEAGVIRVLESARDWIANGEGAFDADVLHRAVNDLDEIDEPDPPPPETLLTEERVAEQLTYEVLATLGWLGVTLRYASLTFELGDTAKCASKAVGAFTSATAKHARVVYGLDPPKPVCVRTSRRATFAFWWRRCEVRLAFADAPTAELHGT